MTIEAALCILIVQPDPVGFLCVIGRQPLSYSQVSLESAGQNVYYIYQTLSDTRALLDSTGKE